MKKSGTILKTDKEMEEYLTRNNRDVKEDCRLLLREYADKAFLINEKTESVKMFDPIVDVYKPFGNSNIVGDIEEILNIGYDEDGEAIERTEKQVKEDTFYITWLYEGIPLSIRMAINHALEKHSGS